MRHQLNAAKRASALERAAQTIRQCDGLPFPELGIRLGFRVDGEPMVIMEFEEALDAYRWANHLKLRPLWLDTVKGSVEWRTCLDEVWWSFLYCPEESDDDPIPLVPADVTQTQALPVVAEVIR